MGNTRRARARHQARDADVAVHIAWAADEAEVAEAKQLAHDALIIGLGSRRRSGVRWIVCSGDEALKLIDTLSRETGGVAGNATNFVQPLIDAGRVSGGDGDGYAPIHERLRTRGGFLIVAMANAVKS